jgi:hypothetical protein
MAVEYKVQPSGEGGGQEGITNEGYQFIFLAW